MFEDLFGSHAEQEPEQDGWTFDSVASIVSLVEGMDFLIEGIWTGAQHGDLLGLKGIPFFVPLCVEWPEGAIVRLLERYGIKMYGYCVANGEQFFYVDRQAATRVQAIFNAYGVPTVEPGEDIQWKA